MLKSEIGPAEGVTSFIPFSGPRVRWWLPLSLERTSPGEVITGEIKSMDCVLLPVTCARLEELASALTPCLEDSCLSNGKSILSSGRVRVLLTTHQGRPEATPGWLPDRSAARRPRPPSCQLPTPVTHPAACTPQPQSSQCPPLGTAEVLPERPVVTREWHLTLCKGAGPCTGRGGT